MKVIEGYRKVEMRPWHETVSWGQTGQSRFIPPLSVLLVCYRPNALRVWELSPDCVTFYPQSAISSECAREHCEAKLRSPPLEQMDGRVLCQGSPGHGRR